jgi:uncharacterized metal-binding protein
MSEKPDCAKCTRVVCKSEASLKGPDNCPTKTRQRVIQKALSEYDKPEIREFALQASIQEAECHMLLEEGMTPRYPRVEETAQFAKKMGYKRLGVAFCIGLKDEAKTLVKILENRGFEVVSVCCKAGAIPKERIGITDEQKINRSGAFEAMCSPISQAEILNSEKTEFNILVGLCVGHDSLFLKYAKAPSTVLVAKDRVFGHNPVMGLYLASSPYYRKLLRKDSLDQ